MTCNTNTEAMQIYEVGARIGTLKYRALTLVKERIIDIAYSMLEEAIFFFGIESNNAAPLELDIIGVVTDHERT
jgi:hypothetical protein